VGITRVGGDGHVDDSAGVHRQGHGETGGTTLGDAEGLGAEHERLPGSLVCPHVNNRRCTVARVCDERISDKPGITINIERHGLDDVAVTIKIQRIGGHGGVVRGINGRRGRQQPHIVVIRPGHVVRTVRVGQKRIAARVAGAA